jgi:NhaA family Na+:H+ antiporter
MGTLFKLSHEAASGVVLMLASGLAILLANSPFASYYDLLLSVRGTVRLDGFGVDKPALLWINDGLMAMFFLLVGLEIKREVIAGELSDRRRALLPIIGAIGGMAVPAMVLSRDQLGRPVRLAGLGGPGRDRYCLGDRHCRALGSRVAPSLKLFLTALAIIDDLGAIVIIAIFYTSDLSWLSLYVALAALMLLLALNLAGVRRIIWYVLVGLMMWVFVLKSGVHATLAGVALALAIPYRTGGTNPRRCCGSSTS